ncbi:hypothetical protein [Bacillus sp. FJAT-45037]|nr:hypothetical protein [Bacillus sp. FJAT-45037]
MLKKKSLSYEVREPMVGLMIGLALMIAVFLIAHFVFGLEFFS